MGVLGQIFVNIGYASGIPSYALLLWPAEQLWAILRLSKMKLLQFTKQKLCLFFQILFHSEMCYILK